MMIIDMIFKWAFRLGWLMLGIAIGWLVIIAVPNEIARDEKAKLLADAGCEYLGHPKYLNTVYFYDCSGEIRIKRVE